MDPLIPFYWTRLLYHWRYKFHLFRPSRPKPTSSILFKRFRSSFSFQPTTAPLSASSLKHLSIKPKVGFRRFVLLGEISSRRPLASTRWIARSNDLKPDIRIAHKVNCLIWINRHFRWPINQYSFGDEWRSSITIYSLWVSEIYGSLRRNSTLPCFVIASGASRCFHPKLWMTVRHEHRFRLFCRLLFPATIVRHDVAECKWRHYVRTQTVNNSFGIIRFLNSCCFFFFGTLSVLFYFSPFAQNKSRLTFFSDNEHKRFVDPENRYLWVVLVLIKPFNTNNCYCCCFGTFLGYFPHRYRVLQTIFLRWSVMFEKSAKSVNACFIPIFCKASFNSNLHSA